MEKAAINGVDIAFDVKGEGEPVLLIHGGAIADGMKPLMDQPAFAGFKLINYHRRGFGESGGQPPAEISTDADDARKLLEHLDSVPAHLIGHSYGGLTALQLAGETPSVARSIVSLEGGDIARIPSAKIVREGFAAALKEPLEKGDVEGALDRSLRILAGLDYRTGLEKNVGAHAFAQGVTDAMRAGANQPLRTFSISREQAVAITCPVFLVTGSESDAAMREGFAEYGFDAHGVNVSVEVLELTRSLLPSAETVTLPGLTHALQMQDPAAVAAAVADFLVEHRSAHSA